MCIAKSLPTTNLAAANAAAASRTRHFSAPATIDLKVCWQWQRFTQRFQIPYFQAKTSVSELRLRLASGKSSQCWKSCRLKSSLEEGDQPLACSDPIIDRVDQTTCPQLPSFALMKNRQQRSPTNLSTCCCSNASSSNTMTEDSNKLTPMSSSQHSLPPQRWPSETRFDPGGSQRPSSRSTKCASLFSSIQRQLLVLIFSIMLSSAVVHPVEGKSKCCLTFRYTNC